MPSISMFYGLIIYMYFIDNKQHKLPHIHVKYQDDEVIVQIPDGTVLEGSILQSKMKSVFFKIVVAFNFNLSDSF
ncbi:MAG TPA: DUF4160 domain-containing protein, partial [Halothiobacillus sp.]|nr:DUF4160 domain-containing protein [Halothiobacillus sp.]